MVSVGRRSSSDTIILSEVNLEENGGNHLRVCVKEGARRVMSTLRHTIIIHVHMLTCDYHMMSLNSPGHSAV